MIVRKAKRTDDKTTVQNAPEIVDASIMATVKIIPIHRLKHHPKNPRVHNERNIQAIMKSLKQFKQLAPLVIWGPNNFVIAGNGRLEALHRLGESKVPVIRADHLSEEDAESFMIADNKTGDLSTFDFKLVTSIMKNASHSAIDATGFSDIEIEPLMGKSWEPTRPASVPTSKDEQVPMFAITFAPNMVKVVSARLDELRYEGESNEDVILRALGLS